jgi:hypothetical protein
VDINPPQHVTSVEDRYGRHRQVGGSVGIDGGQVQAMLLLQCSGNATLRLLGATLSQSLHRSSMREFIASGRRAQLAVARAHDCVLDAVAGGDSRRAWKEMGRLFMLSERIARHRPARQVPVPGAAAAEPGSAP